MSSPSLAAPRVSPELRAAIYHFAVFGSTGVASVYFGIWLTNRGITADEIGVINAAPVLGMLAVNVMIGRLADRNNTLPATARWVANGHPPQDARRVR